MAQQALFAPVSAFQNGVYAPGAKATFYLSGTTTPATVYADADLSVPHVSPMVADSYGVFAQAFTGGANELKAVITAADDTVVATIDPVPLTTSTGTGASEVSFTPVTGNAGTNAQDAIANNTTEVNKVKGIGALAANGLIARTGADTYAARTITGSDGVTIANGDGASGNPTLSLGIATQAEAEAGTNNTKAMTPLRAKQLFDAGSVLGTSVAATGSEVDFTGIPSWATEISVMLNGVSLSGTDNILIQLGDSGGFETTAYNDSKFGDAISLVTSTSGFIIRAAGAANAITGRLELRLFGPATNSWNGTSVAVGVSAGQGAGYKALSDTLTQIRVTRTGTDTFDAGFLNIFYR